MTTLALTAVLTASCTSSSDGDGGPGTGDTLRVALNYAPTGLDPHRATSKLAGHAYIAPMYDRLTQIGDDLKVEPMLATSWKYSDDGLSLTFTLRDDAEFWDGSPVDAAAVKASLERAMTLPESTMAAALEGIDRVEAPDAGTVVITTTRPAAQLPATLAGLPGAVINPKSLDDPELDVKPAGSGPYRLDRRTGDTLVLTSVPEYWDPEAQKSPRIEITGIPNDQTRLSALKSGQIDLAMTTLGQVEEAEDLGDEFTTYEYPAASTYAIYLNSGLDPLQQTKVRQALNWAIDREAISTSLLAGRCEPTAQLLGPVFDGHLDDPPVEYEHDPQKARALLAEAGVEDLSLKFLVSSGITLYEELGTAIQGQLSEVGVDVELVPQEGAQIFESWGAGDVYAGWGNVRATEPSAAMTLEAAYLNPARYPGPVPGRLREMLDSARDPQISSEELTDTLEQANALVNESALDVFICSAPALWTARESVVGADDMSWSNFSAFGDFRYVGKEGGR